MQDERCHVNDLGEGPPPAGLPAHRTATGALQTIVRTVLYNCQPGATQDPSVYVGGMFADKR